MIVGLFMERGQIDLYGEKFDNNFQTARIFDQSD